jgi:AraC-like DNA-binding protein
MKEKEDLLNSFEYFINENYSNKNIKEIDIVNYLNYSHSTLNQIIVAKYGIPVMEFLGRVRIIKSIELLCDNKNMLWDRCGFKSAFVFSRNFKKYVGITKSELKIILCNNADKKDIFKKYIINSILSGEIPNLNIYSSKGNIKK